MSRRWILAAAAAALVASCASLPVPEEAGTLLVIPIRAGRSSYSGFPLAYQLGVRESDRRIRVTVRDGFAAISRLPAGTYTIDRIYTTIGPELAGGVYLDDGKADPVGPWQIVLREGEIAVLPVGFAVSVEQRWPEAHRQVLVPFRTDRSEVLQDLRRRGDIGAWRISDQEPVGSLPLGGPSPRNVYDRFKWD